MINEGVILNDIASILYSTVAAGVLIANYMLLKGGSKPELQMSIWSAINITLLVGYMAAFFSGSLFFLLIAAVLIVSLIGRRKAAKQLQLKTVSAA